MKRNVSLRLVLLSLVAVCGFLGCMGGGGGSKMPFTGGENEVIAGRLNLFAQSLSAGNQLPKEYFSSHVRNSAVADQLLRTLTVYDFGQEIENPDDNHAWTFNIPADGIEHYAENLARVTAYSDLPGMRLTLVFSMIKEEGYWYIEEITVTATGSGAFSVAEYLPQNRADHWVYVDETYSPDLYKDSLIFADESPVMIAGKNFMKYSFGEEAIPPVGGVGAVSVRLNGTLFHHSFFPGIPQMSGACMSNQGGWSFAVEGSSDFNNGQPWRILDELFESGSTTVATITYIEGGESVTVVQTVEVLNPETVMVPAGDFSVIPVVVTATFPGESSRVEKIKYYLARNMGVVKVDVFYPSDLLNPGATLDLFDAKIGAQTYSNPPVISDFPIAVETGQDFMGMFAVDAGTGQSPFFWSIPPGETPPPGMILNNSTGEITGTAGPIGSGIFTVSVIDRFGQIGTRSISWTISESSQPPPQEMFYKASVTDRETGTVVVSFFADAECTVPVTLDTPVEAGDFCITDLRVNKVPSSTDPRYEYGNTTVGVFGNAATIQFNSTIFESSNILLSCQDITGTSGSVNYEATGGQVELGNHLMFKQLISWNTAPKKILMPGEADRNLFFLFDSELICMNIQENVVQISPSAPEETVLAISSGPKRPPLASEASETFLHIIVTEDSLDPSIVYLHALSKDLSGSGHIRTYLIEPATFTHKPEDDIVFTPDPGLDGVNAYLDYCEQFDQFVVVDGQRIFVVDQDGNIPSQNSHSSSLIACDSFEEYEDGSVLTPFAIRAVDATGNFVDIDLSDGITVQQTSTYLQARSPVDAPVGLMWLIWTGTGSEYENKYLLADFANNKAGFFDATSSPVTSGIVIGRPNDGQNDYTQYLGYLKNPIPVTVFGNDENATQWVLVGDEDGLNVFRHNLSHVAASPAVRISRRRRR